MKKSPASKSEVKKAARDESGAEGAARAVKNKIAKEGAVDIEKATTFVDPKNVIPGELYIILSFGSTSGDWERAALIGVSGEERDILNAIISIPESYNRAWAHGVSFDKAPVEANPAFMYFGALDDGVRLLKKAGNSSLLPAKWSSKKTIDGYEALSGYFKDNVFHHGENGNSGLDLHLMADGAPGAGRTVWWTGSNGNYTSFSIFKLLYAESTIYSLISDAWPKTIITNAYATRQDRKFVAMFDSVVQDIYNNSPLPNMEEKGDIIKSDDLSYVFKAYASMDAYENIENVASGYAIGILIGQNGNQREAVNFFVDYLGDIKLLDPRTGNIMAPSDWSMKPKFVLL